MRYQVSHSYKTVDRIIAVYLFFIYLYLRFKYFLQLQGNICFIYSFIFAFYVFFTLTEKYLIY